MSWSTIATEIQNILSSIPNIGRVYTYHHITQIDRDVVTDFTTTGLEDAPIRVWFIRRADMSNETLALSGFEYRIHTVEIVGFWSLQEPNSENEFQDMIDTIIDTLEPKITLNNTVTVAKRWQVSEIGITRFVRRTVHHVTLTCELYERKTYNYA